jgi:predicted MFS family arabinose efflux permease
MASAIIGGGIVGSIIKISGSYTTGLVVTGLAFIVCGIFAFRLPGQVDSAVPVRVHPDEAPRPLAQEPVPTLRKIVAWANHGMDPMVVVSLQGEAALRFLSGVLTIYFAFWVESAYHGLDAAGALGGIALASGVGTFLGTGIGTRLKLHRAEIVILIGVSVAAASCLICAATFNLTMAIIGMFVSGITNALSKIALDAVVQHDVPEAYRSSVFARTETFLQLAWVVGAVLGVVLPPSDGSVGFWVSSGALSAVAVVCGLRRRALVRQTTPGNVNAVHEPSHDRAQGPEQFRPDNPSLPGAHQP